MAEPEIATIEDIIGAGEKDFEIPGLDGKKIRCRKVSGAEYATTLPADPPESLSWPTDGEARREAHQKWAEAQSTETMVRRRQAFADSDYKLVALAAIAPPLTVEDCRRLGNGAAVIANELLAWSMPKKADEKTDKAEASAG